MRRHSSMCRVNRGERGGWSREKGLICERLKEEKSLARVSGWKALVRDSGGKCDWGEQRQMTQSHREDLIMVGSC